MLKKSQVYYFSDFYYRHLGGSNFYFDKTKCVSRNYGMPIFFTFLFHFKVICLIKECLQDWMNL
jgi:hypothetical protein